MLLALSSMWGAQWPNTPFVPAPREWVTPDPNTSGASGATAAFAFRRKR